MSRYDNARAIAEVKGRINIADLAIELGIQLSSKGKAKCPFPDHVEKTPSFYVRSTTQRYHCFGCGKDGDAITLVQELKNLTFPEALGYLAKKTGVELPRRGYDHENDRHRMNFEHVMELVTQFYQDSLPDSPAEDYLLNKRKLSEDTVSQFRLGYSQDSWDALPDFLRDHRVDEKTMTKLGLVKERGIGEGVYALWKGRVAIPLITHSGKTVGFAYRALPGEKEDIKYANSPETPLFKKNEFLYAMNLATAPARASKRIYLFEGYFDAIHAHQAGIENVVATMGTALTPEHALLLESRFPDCKIVLCFDNDAGGIKLALSQGARLLGRSNSEICLLPEGKDPADILEAGEDLRKYLMTTNSFVNFYIDQKGKGIDTFEGAQKFVRTFGKEVYAQTRSGLRPLIAKNLAEKLGIEINQATKLLREYDREDSSRDRLYWETRILGELLATSPKQRRNIMSKLDKNDFSTLETTALFTFISQPDSYFLDIDAGLYKEGLIREVIRVGWEDYSEALEHEKVEKLVNGALKHTRPMISMDDIGHSLVLLRTQQIGSLEELVRGIKDRRNFADLLRKLKKDKIEKWLLEKDEKS